MTTSAQKQHLLMNYFVNILFSIVFGTTSTSLWAFPKKNFLRMLLKSKPKSQICDKLLIANYVITM